MMDRHCAYCGTRVYQPDFHKRIQYCSPRCKELYRTFYLKHHPLTKKHICHS